MQSATLRFLTLFAAITSGIALAQFPPASRITQRIDDRFRVTLAGNVYTLAQARFDQGAVPDSFPAERMFLLLERSPEQEYALRQFINDAHTSGNPSYHKWLKPEQFGRLYGPADSDVAATIAWLQSHGFSVARVTRGKTAIEFSGSAGQVREAFNTEIHTYLINGKEHHANNREPQIPAALGPVVAGVTALNDFPPKSSIEVLGRATYDSSTHQLAPSWTQSANLLVLAPDDFAVQYDLNPLYSAGTNGTSVTIGIISVTNIDPTLVASYRALFGLPAAPVNVIIDGNDPGVDSVDVIETYLDVEVSGAVAPNATINLYASLGTFVQDGLNLAAQRAVDDDEAAVLSTSYLNCEQELGAAGNQFWAALWEQAAAQGQTSLVASGDGGSAGCDDFDLPAPAQYGLAVNGISSTPWNVSIGGTDFYYSSYDGSAGAQESQLATYWNLTPAGLPSVSLLKPIPEQPWNDTFGLNLSTGGKGSPDGIIAGSGGASSCSNGVGDGSYASCTSGYSKPAWQAGAGVPADRVRDIPDLSLFAADAQNCSFYPICAEAGDCTPANGSVGIFGVGGTSAASPAMAGIMALVVQKYGTQGQANFTLYPLATQHPSVFHDITIGSNDVPCQQGTPDCTLSTLDDNTDGFYTLGHFYATAGYDQATGLGSVDANLLVQNWNSLSFTSTDTTLTLSQSAFTHGTAVTATVGVTGSGGTPSGDVGLVATASPTVNTGLSEFTLQSGGASAKVDSFPGGRYTLTARYAGDSTFASSSSTPVALNVAPENSTISMSGSYDSNSTATSGSLLNGGSYSYGTFIDISAQPIGVNATPGSTDGKATGTAIFTDAASTGTVSSGALDLASNGAAAWGPNLSLTGFHSLSATYSGDASFNASSSTMPLTFTITKAAPFSSTLSASPSPVAVGSNTALTLQICGVPSGTVPSGTATFYFGAKALGTASLGPSSSSCASSSAVLEVSSLPLGADSVTATYNGDANYNPVTSSATNVVVEEPSNLSVSVDPGSVNQAESFTVTATVPGVAGVPAATGSVVFSAVSGGSSSNGTATLMNGSATNTFANVFPVGSVSVTVSYSGDSVYAPANTTLSVADTVPFAISGTAVTVTVPGATTGNTSTITITPENAFVGAVYLSCALSESPSGAQYPPNCSILPSVNITGTSAVAATMTITSTPAASSALVFPSHGRMHWLAASGAAALIGILLGGIPLRVRRRSILLPFVFLLAILVSLVGCGGGGSGSSVGTGIPGTTPGTYTFIVTSSFTATASANQTVTTAVTVTIE